MCMQHLEQAAVDEFSGRMVQILNHASLALMTSLGHRTGLFDTMATMAPASSAAIARKAGLSERYVREWLGAMVSGSIVQYDEENQHYHLPQEHAAFLTRAASPNNLAVSAQWIALLGSVEDHVADAFEHGKGVPYSAYRNFHRVMAEESDQTTVGGLVEHILPLVPGLRRELEAGIDVLDIACGAGNAMITLAELYPNSRFVGYDFSEEAIAIANQNAKARGLRNVRFEARDVAAIDEPGRYDLITAFDAIHDQARPDTVLSCIHRSLKNGGTFLMQDIAASSEVHRNGDLPLGPFTYTVSTMHCMSVSLANGGPGLGAAWGKELALKMLEDAGFKDVSVSQLPHDIINYYYVMRKD